MAPPWGTLNAINLNTGEYVWKIPLGEYPELAAKGLKNTGTENYGGPLVTAGGLVFIGATNFDKKFRAFDKSTGALLWETTAAILRKCDSCYVRVERTTVRGDRGGRWKGSEVEVGRSIRGVCAEEITTAPRLGFWLQTLLLTNRRKRLPHRRRICRRAWPSCLRPNVHCGRGCKTIAWWG